MVLKQLIIYSLANLLPIVGSFATDLGDSADSTSSNLVESVSDHVFVHGATRRTYKLYVPSNLDESPPLLFVLHGMSMTSHWASERGFNELADQHGFVVVYPQSLKKTIFLTDYIGMPELGWFAVHEVVRWNSENQDDRYGGNSDLDFLSELAKNLQREYGLNSKQTFVAGFSSGGEMSYALVCQAGKIFRGAGIVAGLMRSDTLDGCAANRPKPLIHLHGTSDSMAPIDGHKSTWLKRDSRSTSAQDSVRYFAKLNNAAKMEEIKVSENTTAHIYTAEGDGAEVRFYRIKDFIHYWPGTPYQGKKKGKQLEDNSGISATALIWEFFSKY